MEQCFDVFEYRNQQIKIMGWAAPDMPGEPLTITVSDAAGNQKESLVKTIRRPDVGVYKYQNEQYDQYGFEVTFPYASETDLILKIVAGEDQLVHPFSPVDLYKAFQHKHSFLVQIKHYLKSEDKKNFWKFEKYKDLDEKDAAYAVWKENHQPTTKELKVQKNRAFADMPMFSLVIPVYNPDLRQLKELFISLEKQSYTAFDINLAIASEYTEGMKKLISDYEKKLHIQTILLSENGGISKNTNEAIKAAKGNWICFMDQDDLLSPDAFYEYAKEINSSKPDVIYCDEDKLDDETGFFFAPHFKSDFNPELLTCNNYICHMVAVRREVLDIVGLLDPAMDGAQDHDFLLRLSEYTDRFAHISKVLYSWRSHRTSTAMNAEVKTYAFDAGAQAVKNHFSRLGVSAGVAALPLHGWYKTSFTLSNEPLVSVIIPNKDHVAELSRCLESLTKSIYKNLEILIVENNSEDVETFAYYNTLKNSENIRVLKYEGAFNYSKINNFAAAEAQGDYFLLLNNDTEMISPDAIQSMLGYAMLKGVGAVGAKLYYADDTVQHAGVLVGVSEGADHVYLRASKGDPGYMGRLIVSQDMSAVTAACMLVSADTLKEVKGLDEEFVVAYNDVDFCLKIRDKGKRIVFDAFSEWYHYESVSRGYEISEAQKTRFETEKKRLKEKWPKLSEGDPYYNRNLSLAHGYYEL